MCVTSCVSLPPTILSPSPDRPLQISNRVSWPGTTAQHDGSEEEEEEEEDQSINVCTHTLWREIYMYVYICLLQTRMFQMIRFIRHLCRGLDLFDHRLLFIWLFLVHYCFCGCSVMLQL